MDNRIDRFKITDRRFYPYVVRVFERLPEEVREDVINAESFQILTDEGFLNACALRYEFDNPVETIVYLNTKVLREPDHQIIHTIASEIAQYFKKKEGTNTGESLLDDLLIEWGFEKEVEAVRYDQAISYSKEYKIGYDWAKKQSSDYLLQHFGLYFDQWNDEGFGSLAQEELALFNNHAETDPILENTVQLKKGDSVDSRLDNSLATFSIRKSMLAGIMVAVKEFKEELTL